MILINYVRATQESCEKIFATFLRDFDTLIVTRFKK